MTARVDILMPTYEPDPNFLREAVESVFAQTEKSWSFLIHDDGSQRDVRAMLEPFLGNPRVLFIRGRERKGIGGNWNACLRRGESPALQYIFQDDAWESRYLERALGALDTHPRVGLVSVTHDYRFEGRVASEAAYRELERFKREHVIKHLWNGAEFLRWWMGQGLRPNVIGEPSFVMLRRATTEVVGPFDETMPQFLDVEYWARCMLETDCLFLAEKLGFFRVHGKAASAANAESGAGIYDRLRCFEKLIGLMPPGELRRDAVASRNRALEGMVAKFFARLRSGKRMGGGKGGGVLKRLALKHPFVILSALVKGAFRRTP